MKKLRISSGTDWIIEPLYWGAAVDVLILNEVEFYHSDAEWVKKWSYVITTKKDAPKNICYGIEPEDWEQVLPWSARLGSEMAKGLLQNQKN